MSVTVDYLVVCAKNKDLTPILAKLLEDAIKTIYNEESIDDELLEEDELRQYITINYTKNIGTMVAGSADFRWTSTSH